MEIQRHFIDANGNHFVAPFDTQELADAYVPPEDATEVDPPPPPDQIEPPPSPQDFALTKRQICAALILNTITLDPDAWMRNVMDAITDPMQRALALNDWENAPAYLRDNPLFSNPDLLTAAGMTAEQIDGLWMFAKDLPP